MSATQEFVDEMEREVLDARLGRELVALLSEHCGERGDSEGAVETLQRIIRERGALKAQHCGEWIGLSEV